MSNEPHTPAAPAAPPKKSRKGLFIVLALLIVVLAGAGGGAWWFMFRGAEAEAAEAEDTPDAAPAATGVVPLEPFVVNLADPGVSRFLRVTLALVVANEEIAKELEHDGIVRMRLRSAILELLSQKQSNELVTPEGKAELKKAIAHAAEGALAAGAAADDEHHLEVPDVLFAEFIVQY
jgi:flagellar FliL protein